MTHLTLMRRYIDHYLQSLIAALGKKYVALSEERTR